MAITIEEYEAKHVDNNGNKIEDKDWFYMHSMLGTNADRDAAYDENGNFHCIKFWNCEYCPAFNEEYCV